MPSQDEAQAAFDGFVDMWTSGRTGGLRAPILHHPGELDLKYEDVSFPSADGVRLEGWFIPADSNRLIIHNHFLPGNRSGYPGHLPQFSGLGGFEVNFLPEYKALHDAGYNILCYDMSNHGMSGSRERGTGIGLVEYQDVIGSVRYAKSRPDTASMETFLLSVCLGGDSTCVAMAKHPAEFSHIKSLILLQPVSADPIVENFVRDSGIPDGYARFDQEVFARTGFHLAEQSPIEYAKSIQIPTLVAQVHHDTMTRPDDVQAIYDAIPTTEKKLHWIEGTTRRFDGYNYFGEHPEVAIDWFDNHAG